MNEKQNLILILLITLIMLGCTLTQASIEEPIAAPTTEVIRLASPTPVYTQAIEKPKERWMLYEDALAAAILLVDEGYCEWEILGQDGQEVYLWVICQVAGDPNGHAASLPVVITLTNYGGIERVEMPRDGTLYGEDIRVMFPLELQSIIFDQAVDVKGMWAHIQSRHANPEPPLIVLENFPLP